jgi:hypothetical protein
MRYRSQDLNKGGPEEDAKETVGNERPVPSGHNRRMRIAIVDLCGSAANAQGQCRSRGAFGSLPNRSMRRYATCGSATTISLSRRPGFSGHDPPALRLTTGLMATRACDPGAHETEKRMLSTPRQLRVSVNRKVINPQTPGEADISHFEILSALPVNAAAAFTDENGRYCRNTDALRHRHIARSLARTGALPPFEVETLTLSVEPCAFG